MELKRVTHDGREFVVGELYASRASGLASLRRLKNIEWTVLPADPTHRHRFHFEKVFAIDSTLPGPTSDTFMTANPSNYDHVDIIMLCTARARLDTFILEEMKRNGMTKT